MADRNSNAPHVGYSLESPGLSGDEASVTTLMAMSQGGNQHNNMVNPTCCLPTADSNYDAGGCEASPTVDSNHAAPHVGDSLESLALDGDETCLDPPPGPDAVFPSTSTISPHSSHCNARSSAAIGVEALF